MSKNFELLAQVGEQEALFTAASAQPVAAAPEIRTCTIEKTWDEAVAEEEVRLVQRVFLLPGQDAPKSVVICCVDQEENAGPLCARLSEILAQSKTGSVCLIDADLHSPSLHKRYGLENQLGVADAAVDSVGMKDYVHEIGGGLWLLPAGTQTADKRVIFSPDRLRAQITELHQQFRYMLICAPPLDVFPDAIPFGQLADGVILVLKARSTRRATAVKVKERLQAANVRVLGAVLTNRTYPIPNAIYRRL